jgi:hypothetical protein
MIIKLENKIGSSSKQPLLVREPGLNTTAPGIKRQSVGCLRRHACQSELPHAGRMGHFGRSGGGFAFGMGVSSVRPKHQHTWRGFGAGIRTSDSMSRRTRCPTVGFAGPAGPSSPKKAPLRDLRTSYTDISVRMILHGPSVRLVPIEMRSSSGFSPRKSIARTTRNECTISRCSNTTLRHP